MIDPEEYTPRNAHCAVAISKTKVLLFGGQDSEKFVQFNDLLEVDLESKQVRLIEAKLGDVVPPRRNSHSMVAHGEKAYVFGGANNDGPRNDLFELDLATYKWRMIQLDTKECPLPQLEMHTMHVFQGDKLLLVGGRALDAGKELNEV